MDKREGWKKRNSRKAQVAIFIIIAIVLVAAIALFFILAQRAEKPKAEAFDEENPQRYISNCVGDAVEKAVGIFMPQGFETNPKNYAFYNDTKIAYLCYTSKSYYTCVNQKPMLLESIKKEILEQTASKTEQCFRALITELQARNYNVNLGATESRNISLLPGEVRIEIAKKLNYNKGSMAKSFELFRVNIANPVYDLAIVSQEIGSQEAKYCYFENVGYMLTYPDFRINRVRRDGGETIYELTFRPTGDKANIAVRSCAMPAGL